MNNQPLPMAGKGDLDTTTLRELIDSEGRLIPEDPQPVVPRVAISRPPRASMQDLYERMGSIEIHQGAIERMAYRQSYHWDRYARVFEHMAGVYSVPNCREAKKPYLDMLRTHRSEVISSTYPSHRSISSSSSSKMMSSAEMTQIGCVTACFGSLITALEFDLEKRGIANMALLIERVDSGEEGVVLSHGGLGFCRVKGRLSVLGKRGGYPWEEMNRNLTRVLQTNQQVNTVTPSCETCGGPHSYNDCPAIVGQNQNVYAVGAYNQGGNSYQPQGNRNLLSYRSDNYLGPPGFNVNQNQNRSNQNQNNQVQPYQNRNQGNNQSNNQGRNQFFQGANHNQNQVQNYQAPNTQPPVALPQELTNYIRINENKINSMQTQMNNLATSNRRLESMLGNFIKINTASSSGMGSLPSNTVSNPKGELKAITTRSGLVLDEPSVPMPPPFINPEEDERVEETFIDLEHGEFTIKVPHPLVQKAKQRNFMIHQRDPRHLNIPYPSRMNQEKQKEKDDVQIHKFWQMFKQLHINISLADALILIPKYQKMLKSLLSNKDKLIELANTPVSENYSAVILKKLPEKLDVFVSVGTFHIPPLILVIVEYESESRVPLILEDLSYATARALLTFNGEE
ncbi:hypothetical protein Tco_1311244 [Tanacetum coccineum]